MQSGVLSCFLCITRVKCSEEAVQMDSLVVLSSYLLRLRLDLPLITCHTLFVLRSCFVRSTQLYLHCVLPCMHAVQQFPEQLNNCGPRNTYDLYAGHNCSVAREIVALHACEHAVGVCPSYGVPACHS
jgi:hypothetical protein